MRKIEIVEHVINNTTISRSQAIQAVDCAFDAIEKALCKGESVYIRGFGTIKTYITKERKARNIYKRTTVIIPARRTFACCTKFHTISPRRLQDNDNRWWEKSCSRQDRKRHHCYTRKAKRQ